MACRRVDLPQKCCASPCKPPSSRQQEQLRAHACVRPRGPPSGGCASSAPPPATEPLTSWLIWSLRCRRSASLLPDTAQRYGTLVKTRSAAGGSEAEQPADGAQQVRRSKRRRRCQAGRPSCSQPTQPPLVGLPAGGGARCGSRRRGGGPRLLPRLCAPPPHHLCRAHPRVRRATRLGTLGIRGDAAARKLRLDTEP